MNYAQPWHGETVQPHSPSLLRRAIAASALGNATEWFDYGIYAYLESAEFLLAIFTVSVRRSRALVHFSAIHCRLPKRRSTSCIFAPNRRDRGCCAPPWWTAWVTVD